MKKISIAIAALLLTATVSVAQTFHRALFLDGYRLAYRYNPALQNEGGMLSAGQFENLTRNNFGAGSFLYPVDGEVLTALHPSISAEQFLSSLPQDLYLNGSINYNLFSYGWRNGNAYSTLEANVRAAYSATLPKEIFEIVKKGTSEMNYDLRGFGVSAAAYAEIAYGYSYKINDWLTAGGRAKLLLGIDKVNYNLTRLDMTLSGDVYMADIEANLDLTSRWNKIAPDEEGYLNLMSLSAKDKWKLPSGAGLAVDLGLVATPLDGLTLSASLLDLGGMLWYYGNAGRSRGNITFTGVDGLTIEDIEEGRIAEQFNGVKDEFLNSLKLKAEGDKVALESIPFNVNCGVRYDMPFYKPLAIGATAGYFHQSGMSYSEVRGSLAWNHFPWLGVTADAGIGTFGPVWGAAVNLAICRFRVSVGYEDGFGGTVPYNGWPIKANDKSLTLGLSYDL